MESEERKTQDTAIPAGLKSAFDEINHIFMNKIPYSEIDFEKFILEEVMGYGTTKDELIKNITEFKNLVQNMEEQGKDLNLSFSKTPVHHHISKDGKTALFIQEFELTMQTEELNRKFLTRVSFVFEKITEPWKLIHFHFSVPVETDNDTWHVDEWQREKAKLEKLVDEQTEDLRLKNRELEIEAALEKVRSRSMAMQSSEELGEVISLISEKLSDLNIPVEDGVALITFEDDSKDLNEWMANDSFESAMRFHLPYFDHPVLTNLWEAKEKGKQQFFHRYTAQESRTFHEHIFEHSDYRQSPDSVKEYCLAAMSYATTIAFQKNTAIFINDYSGVNLSEAEKDVLHRFANVFEQTYIRFKDLKKAETQAREAQIETALERVRSRTMGMQKGEELQEVAVLLYKELIALGITNFVTVGYVEVNEEIQRQHTWVTSPGGDTMGLFHLPLTGDDTFDARYAAWKNQETIFHQSIAGQVRNDHLEYAITTFNSKEAEKMVRSQFPDPTVFYCFNFSHGYLHTVGGSLLEKEEELILARFTKVFEQTYTRFLDLQKAEEQAFEAKIETGLEKIRSRTMGMQNSEELPEVANLMFLEIQALGIHAWSCGYCILEEDTHSSTCIMSSEGTLQKPFLLPHRGEASFEEWDDFVHSEASFFVQELKEEAIESHYDFMKSLPQLKPIFQDLVDEGLSLPTYQINHLSKFSHGFLLFITYEEVPEAYDIFKRFTKVFEQTYTRFLDLKKSEKRAREAEVELALERIRAQVTAMQKSTDLFDIVVSMRNEFTSLGFQADYFWHMHWLPDSYEMSMTSEDGERIGMVISIPKHVHAQIPELAAWEQGDEPILALALNANDAWDYIENMNEYGRYEQADPNAPSREDIEALGGLTFIIARTSHGEIGYSLPGEVPNPPKAATRTLTRFAGVFDLAYQRFEDLQEAEQRVRETQIELSLERIRAKVSAMQESSDLQELMVDMRTEFTSLGYEAHYFWYMRWLKDTYKKAMTSGDGTKIGMVMTLPRKIHGDIESVAQWEQSDEPYMVLAMDTDTAVDYVDKMISWGDFEQLDPQAPSLDDIRHIGGLTFIMARTTQGEIGYSLPGVVPEPPREAIDTLIRFARVFDLAYQRFEDLKEAERQSNLIRAERDRLEKTLNELHSTQDQLIQQEKLASLGQLTAGIAHEIKNPLNFVNNFSDLSIELVKEALDELKLYPSESKEVTDILNDIAANLKKVHEHGSRADNIVKSMLQHSRGGSGKKEPTHINNLLKEYATLAFHGMRASKSPINVDIKMELDEKVGELDLISEDFSRVIVNLCNNAFDAMREKGLIVMDERPDYQPVLTVRSRSKKKRILVEVEDNGPGIPKEIQDKILQPFFTTKKGTQGTGLGLSITNDIIKAHGGKLDIQSKNGSGTTFSIQLPHQYQSP